MCTPKLTSSYSESQRQQERMRVFLLIFQAFICSWRLPPLLCPHSTSLFSKHTASAYELLLLVANVGWHSGRSGEGHSKWSVLCVPMSQADKAAGLTKQRRRQVHLIVRSQNQKIQWTITRNWNGSFTKTLRKDGAEGKENTAWIHKGFGETTRHMGKMH